MDGVTIAVVPFTGHMIEYAEVTFENEKDGAVFVYQTSFCVSTEFMTKRSLERIGMPFAYSKQMAAVLKQLLQRAEEEAVDMRRKELAECLRKRSTI